MMAYIKFAFSILFVVLLVGVLANQDGIRAYAKEKQMIDTPETETYIYLVTDVAENEILGDALTGKRSDNAGIFLYKSDLNFDVKVGDKISVTFTYGILDDIQTIKKL